MVLLMENVPSSLRGELTRWFVEPRTGVFVGKVSANVRDLLWEMVCDKVKTGGALLLYSSNTEQGYAIRSWGDVRAELTDWEGLMLFRRPLSPKDEEMWAKEERARSRQEELVSREGVDEAKG